MSYFLRLTYSQSLMESNGNTFEIDFKPVGFFLNESGKVFSADHILYSEGSLSNQSLLISKHQNTEGLHIWEMEINLDKASEHAHQLCIGIFLSKPDDLDGVYFDAGFRNFDVLLELFENDKNFPIYRYRLSKDFPFMQNMEVGIFKKHITYNSWHWHNLAKDINLNYFGNRIGVNFT